MYPIISINTARPFYYATFETTISNVGNEFRTAFITIKNNFKIVEAFTGLEYFACDFNGKRPRTGARQKAKVSYVCKALNIIRDQHPGMRIIDISKNHIYECFQIYCNTAKNELSEVYPGSQSCTAFIATVSAFFANIALCFDTKYHIDDLMEEKFFKRNPRSSKLERTYEPVYKAKVHQSLDYAPLRDIPQGVAERIIQLAETYDPMIAFAIGLQVYGGLRPAEAMNVRQMDSPLSSVPGISLSFMNNTVTNIEIDLTREFNLRSDGVSVGKIKKARTVKIYEKNIGKIYSLLKKHENILSQCAYENDFCPMFVNQSGKSMSYSTYCYRLHKLIKTHLIPELLKSECIEYVEFAHKLLDQNLGPHAFRHYFTVNLALDNLGVAEIMFFRGDTNPESALTYLKNKGALVNELHKIHAGVISELSYGE